IISDDFSDDDTAEFAEKKLSLGKFEYRIVKAAALDAQGKKHALWRAIAAAKGDIILTTDADCRLSTHWVASMVVKFHNPAINMVAGMVAIHNGKGLLSKFERMDQLVLSAVGAASITTEAPLLCSGANLAFRKSAFERVGGYSYGINDPSGDDTYLMFQLGTSVAFNKDKDSLVLTEPMGSIRGILNQRIRWASKMSGYGKPDITLMGAFISLVNLVPLLLLVLCMIDFLPFWFFLVWLLLKFALDMILLKPIASFYKQSNALAISPLYALVYPFYTLTALFTLFKKGYEWKGRRYGY
ncbi:MAG: glycosyltransferase, partial [Bacteroidota bacterium]